MLSTFMDNHLRKRLIEVARIPNNTINAQYLCDELFLGLDLQNRHDRVIFYEMLAEVSSHEFAHDRPLLSALVVLKTHNYKRDCFMRICQNLGLAEQGSVAVAVDLLETERSACYRFWATNDNYHRHLD